MIKKAPAGLRSWVQIPPGPFLPSSRIRYWFEFISGSCQTILLAMVFQQISHDNGN
jgi:hypothetical protein